MPSLRSITVVLAGAAIFVACKRSTPAPADAGTAASAGPSSVPVASFLARVLDAGPPPKRDGGTTVTPPLVDAGPLACRLVQGPLQQPFTGPAALVATESGVEVVIHKNGLVKTTTIAAEPVAGAKPTRRVLEGVTPDKASKPACAVAGPYAFCSDAKGDVHRALRSQASDDVVAHADVGAHVAATALSGNHVLLAFLAVRRTTEGRTSEAFVKLDDAEPAKLSEEGSGATDVSLAARRGDAVAVLVDARRAMSPVHARVVSYTDRLTIGPDAVVYVGGGADHQVFTVVGTNDAHAAFALMPDSAEDGFGLTTVTLDDPPRMEAPTHLSLYPNGIDAAPVAATRGAKTIFVARVRPEDAAVGATRVLELGKLDATGAFATFGVVPTSGSVANVALEADAKVPGGVWLHYTDGAGSWIERRVCP